MPRAICSGSAAVSGNSDVDLVAAKGDSSDVAIVASDSEQLLESDIELKEIDWIAVGEELLPRAKQVENDGDIVGCEIPHGVFVHAHRPQVQTLTVDISDFAQLT